MTNCEQMNATSLNRHTMTEGKYKSLLLSTFVLINDALQPFQMGGVVQNGRAIEENISVLLKFDKVIKWLLR
jgi:hypothetical protein